MKCIPHNATFLQFQNVLCRLQAGDLKAAVRELMTRALSHAAGEFMSRITTVASYKDIRTWLNLPRSLAEATCVVGLLQNCRLQYTLQKMGGNLDPEFAGFVLRTARKLTKSQFQAKVRKSVCRRC